MNTKKPPPLHQQPQASRCPVCQQPSYSQSGVHPQCLMRQADSERKEMLRIARAAAKHPVS